MKNQVGNDLNKLFDFRGQITDVSDQAVLTQKDLVLHDEEVNKISISDLITATQMRSVSSLSFIMNILPDQADTKYKHNHLICKVCVHIPLYVGGIDASIDTQMLKNLTIFILLSGFRLWEKYRY